MQNLLEKKIDLEVRRAPKWQQVKRFVVSHMASGKFVPGDALPSENQICGEVGVARSTVRQAFDELEKEGYIYRVQGRGTFFSEFPSAGRKQKQKIFALVLPSIREGLYASLTQGFDSYLSEVSMQTLICDSQEDISRQGNIFMQLLHRGIDGIAVVPTPSGKTPEFQVELLQQNKMPVVLCHRPVGDVSVPSLVWDREQVGRLAGNVLTENGHKDIAYFGVFKYEVTEAHIRGLRQVLVAEGIELPGDRTIFGPKGDNEKLDLQRERLLAGLLAQNDRPTAIVCNNETEAERLFWLSYRMGVKIPDDLSIVAFGDRHRNTIFKKMLTSVVIDELELGKKAARILCEMNDGKRPINDNSVEFMGLDLYEGNTVKKMKEIAK